MGGERRKVERSSKRFQITDKSRTWEMVSQTHAHLIQQRGERPVVKRYTTSLLNALICLKRFEGLRFHRTEIQYPLPVCVIKTDNPAKGGESSRKKMRVNKITHKTRGKLSGRSGLKIPRTFCENTSGRRQS